MEEPKGLTSPGPQSQIYTLDETGSLVPPVRYGVVPARGSGIIDRAKVDREAGFRALDTLGKPEVESRSQEFQGRRLVRIDGGYLILNYMRYRDRDTSAAKRMRNFRDRQKTGMTFLMQAQ